MTQSSQSSVQDRLAQEISEVRAMLNELEQLAKHSDQTTVFRLFVFRVKLRTAGTNLASLCEELILGINPEAIADEGFVG